MVAGTHFHLNDRLKATMDISRRLVGLDFDLTQVISCFALQGLIYSTLNVTEKVSNNSESKLIPVVIYTS